MGREKAGPAEKVSQDGWHSHLDLERLWVQSKASAALYAGLQRRVALLERALIDDGKDLSAFAAPAPTLSAIAPPVEGERLPPEVAALASALAERNPPAPEEPPEAQDAARRSLKADLQLRTEMSALQERLKIVEGTHYARPTHTHEGVGQVAAPEEHDHPEYVGRGMVEGLAEDQQKMREALRGHVGHVHARGEHDDALGERVAKLERQAAETHRWAEVHTGVAKQTGASQGNHENRISALEELMRSKEPDVPAFAAVREAYAPLGHAHAREAIDAGLVTGTAKELLEVQKQLEDYQQAVEGQVAWANTQEKEQKQLAESIAELRDHTRSLPHGDQGLTDLAERVDREGTELSEGIAEIANRLDALFADVKRLNEVDYSSMASVIEHGERLGVLQANVRTLEDHCRSLSDAQTADQQRIEVLEGGDGVVDHDHPVDGALQEAVDSLRAEVAEVRAGDYRALKVKEELDKLAAELDSDAATYAEKWHEHHLYALNGHSHEWHNMLSARLAETEDRMARLEKILQALAGSMRIFAEAFLEAAEAHPDEVEGDGEIEPDRAKVSVKDQ